MIIAGIMGGLGNQLFQYAMARRLAIEHNTDLLLDTTRYGPNGDPRPRELEAFTRPLSLFWLRINARAATEEEIASFRDDFIRTPATQERIVRVIRRIWPGFLWKKSHIIERKYRFQPEALSFPDNVYLQGYWQSPKYFADIASLIRHELQPLDSSICELAAQTVEKLRARYGQVVSLHVRRGDLAHAHGTLGIKTITHGAPISREYIKQAMDQFDGDGCFLVFSDTPTDIEWCRTNISGRNVEFSAAGTELGDFFTMSFCDHHIVANSTFSWWAAWLNDRPGRRVIAPRVWSAPEVPSMPIDDLIPEDWKVL